MAKIIDERLFFAFRVLILIFLFANMDPVYGGLYSIMVVTDLLLYMMDPSVTINFEKTANNRLQAIGWSFFYYGIFVAASALVLSIGSSGFFTQSILGSFAVNSPIFANNPIVNAIAFILLVPFVETPFFFGRVFEVITDSLGLKISRESLKSPRFWGVMVFLGLIFMLFHLTARASGLTVGPGVNLVMVLAIAAAGLITTWVFGVVQCFEVAYFGETKQATGTHVVANGTAFAVKSGIKLALTGSP